MVQGMAAGFVVGVGGPLARAVWYVALDDHDVAMQAARDAAGSAAAYQPVQIIGELGQADLDQLGLALGQVQKKT
jgi:hypothetical protein